MTQGPFGDVLPVGNRRPGGPAADSWVGRSDLWGDQELENGRHARASVSSSATHASIAHLTRAVYFETPDRAAASP